MKCLIVHRTDKGWYGEEVIYKRSGSGFYRETTNITIPQNRDEIVKFAAEGDFSVEWRDIITAPGVVNPASAASG